MADGKGFSKGKKKTFHSIIRRFFRGTGVAIDIEGKMEENLRFPGFETYVPPEKDEEHIDDLLTIKEEIKEIEKREAKFQEEKNKRKRKEREENKRKRAKKGLRK